VVYGARLESVLV